MLSSIYRLPVALRDIQKTAERETTGKRALKLVNLLVLNATHLRRAKIDIPPQSCENLQTFEWWEASCAPPPPHKNVCKISRNLAILLI